MHAVTKMADLTKFFQTEGMFSQTGQSDFYEFIQIRQSEISLADSPILTNFRHCRYCIHFWTKPSLSRSHFFMKKNQLKSTL